MTSAVTGTSFGSPVVPLVRAYITGCVAVKTRAPVAIWRAMCGRSAS
jgi:hypothetical protein